MVSPKRGSPRRRRCSPHPARCPCRRSSRWRPGGAGRVALWPASRPRGARAAAPRRRRSSRARARAPSANLRSTVTAPTRRRRSRRRAPYSSRVTGSASLRWGGIVNAPYVIRTRRDPSCWEYFGASAFGWRLRGGGRHGQLCSGGVSDGATRGAGRSDPWACRGGCRKGARHAPGGWWPGSRPMRRPTRS
ncbi:hypothetical protein F4780DRAFT_516 [Xylariomycetidae sp. FL0641]|nr:hypothetical protein F4780DRAFT_516 [Xylariomycetidae sp. FL0641]